MKKLINLLKKPLFWKIFLAFVLITGVITGGYFYEKNRDKIFIDKSTIQAPVINVSPTVSGKVTEINVKEGQRVEAGDQLAVVG